MPGVQHFVEAFALLMCAAALVAVIFQLLGLPVVVGYLAAGILIGPHMPFALLSDLPTVRGLSELGVILMMFSIGIEFTFERLGRLIPTAGLTTLIEVSLTAWLGYTVAQLIGFSARESAYAAAIVAFSSTTVVAKAFAEEKVRERFTEMVFGILLAEDLVAVVLLTVLAAAFAHRAPSTGEIALTIARLGVFLAALIVVGMFLIPRSIGLIMRLGREETLLVAGVGICFALAFIAERLGYSSAVGAFAAGVLVAESGEGARVQRLVSGVRDVFVAIFFVAVGMMLDPAAIPRYWPAIAIFTAVVIVGKFGGVASGALLTGNSIRGSIRAGMSMLQIGEFSFVIAGLGVATGAVASSLYSVAIAVSVITTLVTPWLIRLSPAAAAAVDRRLPRPIQTLTTLFATWLEQLRDRGRRRAGWAEAARRVRWLLLDAVLLAAILIAASEESGGLAASIQRRLAVSPQTARAAVIAGAIVLCAPFCVGIFRIARRLGAIISYQAFPIAARGELDLGAAPRRALGMTLELGIVMLVGAPLIAITRPFLPPLPGIVILLVVLGLVGIFFWRSTVNLQGHVSAGAEMIVEALATQSRAHQRPTLARIERMLPGFGALQPVTLESGSAAVGRTLGELNLRAATGATVLAVMRGEQDRVIPSAHEVLRAGDVLALAGTHEAIATATRILRGAAGDDSEDG